MPEIHCEAMSQTLTIADQHCLCYRKGLVDCPPRLYSGDLDPEAFPGHAYRSDGRIVDEDVVDAANAIYRKILDRTQLYYRDCLAECPAENHHK